MSGERVPQTLLRAYEVGAVVLFAAVGIALSVAGFHQFRDQGRADLEDTLQRDVAQYVAALQDQVDRHLLLIKSFRALYAASGGVTRAEFRSFADHVVPAFPTMRTVAWLPRVEADRRAVFEAAVRRDGFDGYRIHVPRHPTATSLGAVSFPFRYVEPAAGNEALLGVDVYALADRRQALEQARDTGRIVASKRVRLVEHPDDDYGVVLFAPVYRDGETPPSQTARRADLVGLLVASFRIANLLQAASGAAPMEIFVFDEDAPPGERFLHHYPTPLGSTAAGSVEVVTALPHVKRTVDVGGRRWAMYFMRPPFRLLDEKDLAAWMILAAGLMLTVTLTTYALGTLLRARRSESLTLAIAQTNENLRREVEERRQVEQALRKSEDRLRLAIKSTKLSLFSQDLGLRYTWIFKSPLALTPQETLGRTDAELMSAPDAARLTAIKRKVLETGIGTTEQLPVSLRGRTVYLSVTIEPLFDGDGAISGIIGTGIDITNEREAQEILARARSQAERANEAKSRFLAAASHDLRQPLQATRLFLEVLLLKLAGSPHVAVAEKALAALEASDGLLNTLLDISTLEAGIIKPEFIDFPIRRLLDRMAMETAPQAAAKGLCFRCIPSPVMVRSDPILLERMVRNLISNALRYTPRGGILLGCRRRGGELTIEVWDTGLGIPEDQLEAVFEDFFQLDNPSRDRMRGLGLGLSVVERTARLLGHRVSVRSRVGKGSVFRVTLPVVRQRVRRPAVTAS